MSNLRELLNHGMLTIQNSPRTVPAAGLFVVMLFLAVAVLRSNDAEQRDFEPLFGQCKLTYTERDRVEAALGKSELADHRVVDGQIEVPLGERAAYLAVIEAADCLPPSFHDPTDHAIRNSGLIESLVQKRWRREHAKERELELLLVRSVKGVEDAYVRIDESSQGGLRDKKLKAAVVGVTTSIDDPLDAADVEMIQSLVVGRNAGLKQGDVTIADLTAATVFRGDSTSNPNLAQSQTRQRSEQEWIRRIKNVLSFVPDAEVAVRLEPADADGTVYPASVSVTLSSNYLDDLRQHKLRHGEKLSLKQVESHARAKIQSAIFPLMKRDSQDPDHLVAVNFFEVPLRELPESPWTRTSVWSVIAVVVLLAVAFGWSRRRQEEPPAEPDLRVYAADDSEEDAASSEVDQLQTKLRAYVEEDPDAAAKSLSEFIDRAS